MSPIERLPLRRAANLAVRLVLALAAVTSWAHPSSADLIVRAPDVTLAPGSTGTFEVIISNDGLGPPPGVNYDVAGFSLELSLLGPPGVKFTAVDILTTTPYVFVTPASENGAGPFVTSPDPFLASTTFIASDFEFGPLGSRTMAPGDTFGLARVTFAVDAGAAPGAQTLALGSGTSVTDPVGNLLDFAANDGTVTVTATAVPEPSTLALAVAGIAGALLACRWRSAGRCRGDSSSSAEAP